MFKKITIRNSLIYIGIFTSLFITIIGGLGLFNTQKSKSDMQNMHLELINNLKEYIHIKDVLLIDVNESLNKGLRSTIEADEMLEQIKKKVLVAEESWKTHANTSEQIFTFKIKDSDEHLRKIKSIITGLKKQITKSEIYAQSNSSNATLSYSVKNIAKTIFPLKQSLTILIKLQFERINLFIEMQNSAYTSQILVNIFLILFGLIFNFLFISTLIRNIGKPIESLYQQFKGLASGKADLTERLSVKKQDELGKTSTCFNQFMENLLALVKKVQKSETEVTTSAKLIKTTSKKVEDTVLDFGSLTDQVGATSKKISATSQDLVKTVQAVIVVTSKTAELASSGQSNLVKMETTMEKMEDAAKQISSRLAVISEKAANITNVVTTITKIADQTNLLSLNASIEAEKAGEYGLGFTVVAREIRRLADQVAMATLDIEQMVKEMKSAVSAGVSEMNKFSKEVNKDVDDVRTIGEQLTQIIDKVQTLTPQFQTVKEGVQGQADGAKQISQSMEELSNRVHQTTISLSNSNSIIKELTISAEELRKEVGVFNTKKIDTQTRQESTNQEAGVTS